MSVASSTINERGLSWWQFSPSSRYRGRLVNLKRKPVLFLLYAVDAVTGSKIWSFPTGGGVTSSPALSRDGKAAYVGSNDNNLYTVSVPAPPSPSPPRRRRVAIGEGMVAGICSIAAIYLVVGPDPLLEGPIESLTPSKHRRTPGY